ncbi:pentatricopeptide repeat-containing protein At1g09220, mitochondrial-like [Telopea speciosissima]|uniref:pentatricopeptide repeat-containing protein At1g09220, mitochondrial-like n=1 Tax=Telopea speciosissima TaxID=54955 RepID=UPI001CC3F4AF|nr:pentatricopeptide repeat-containing protein At1g09220, mitochondrial-like [Telopea speciosissima]
MLSLKSLNRVKLIACSSTSSLTASLIFSSKQSTLTHALVSQPDQRQLLSLLTGNPTRSHSLQIHSKLITTGFCQCRVDNAGMLIWNTLLREYSLGIFPEEALKLYKQVLGVSAASSYTPDSFTYSFLLKACANLDQTIKGNQVYAHVIKVGYEFHVYVQTALVNLFSVCGCLIEAKRVFDEMPERNLVTWNVMITGLVKWGEIGMAQSLFDRMLIRNVVSWTCMIDGYTRMNQPVEALRLFTWMMIDDGIKPTELTLLAILPSISNLGALDICQSIHSYSEKAGFNASDIRVTNSFIDSYAKCGCIDSAFKVFKKISTENRNLVSWTSIISAFAMHGMATEAIEWFEKMEQTGLSPNEVTFLSLLNACSHGGLVEEGLEFYSKMVNRYQILPNIKHYGCLVDMLGRAGRLEDAEKMVMQIPTGIVNVILWRTLLGACSFHGNVEMGERVMRKVLEMERGYSGDYVLLSNIFAGVGRFEDAESVRRSMDERDVLKIPGFSLHSLQSRRNQTMCMP